MLEFVGKISAYQYVDETFKHFVNEDFIVVFAVLKILQSDYISRSSRFFSWFPRYLALVDCLSKTKCPICFPNYARNYARAKIMLRF